MNAAAQPAATTMVELDGVCVRYNTGAQPFVALDQTSLRVQAGDFVALVGPSGCGKSTILRLVTGLLRPSEGAVSVAGRAIGAARPGVGMAFQNPTMLPWLTIRQNVMLPLKIVEPFRTEYRAQKHRAFPRPRRGPAGARRPGRVRRPAFLAVVGWHAAAGQFCAAR